MRAGHYTRLRGRTTYFRRKVPAPLRTRLASTEICFRLGVVSADSAGRLGRLLAVAVDDFFLLAMSNMNLTASNLRHVIRQTVTAWERDQDRHDAAVVLKHGRGLATPREEALDYAELANAVLSAHGRGESLYDEAFVAQRFGAAGMSPPDDAVDMHRAGRALSLGLATHFLRSAVDVTARHGLAEGRNGVALELWQQRLDALIRQQHLDRADSPASESRTLPDQGSIAAGTTGPLGSMPVFSELIAQCLDARIDAQEVTAGARHESQASVRIWLEICGDKPVSEYGRSDFSEFQSVLIRLPRFYWRSDSERRKPIRQVIAESLVKSGKSYPRVGNVTVNRHISTIAPFFDWCVRHGKLKKPHDPFWTGLHLPTGRKITGLAPNEERPAFSMDQITAIFRHPVWTGRKSAYFYLRPGAVIIRDSLYWAPLIAALHGMRREEIAQLHVRHVRPVNGIWAFDLHHVELRTKNSGAHRDVPLHRDLLALGFIEDNVTGRDPSERLFAELVPSAVHDRYGDSVGKRLARVLDDLGIVLIRKNSTEADGVFHPFRHTFITALTAAGVSGGVIDAITGHSSAARASERSRYTGNLHIAVLKDAIDRLNLPIDVQQLYALAASAPGLPLRPENADSP